jgi:hypothetical protein
VQIARITLEDCIAYIVCHRICTADHHRHMLAPVLIIVATVAALWLAPVAAQERTDITVHAVQQGKTLSEIARSMA